MRVFLLRMGAAKNSRKRRAAWSPSIGNRRRHGKRTAQAGRADRRRGLDDRGHVLVLAALAGTIGVNLDPHLPSQLCSLSLCNITSFGLSRSAAVPGENPLTFSSCI